jgi:uncharacterized protein (TIGR02996 family)
MTEDERLLQAIFEAPDDDALRLVFADWLQERGKPRLAARGELMRVQCALARDGLDGRHRQELEASERELLRAHRKAWLGPLVQHVRRWSYRRGLAEVSMSAGKLLKKSETQLSQALARAWVWGIEFESATTRWEALASSPLLRGLGKLTFARPPLPEAGLLALTKGALPLLHELVIAADGIGDDGLRALAQTRSWPRLARLSIEFNPFTPEPPITPAGLSSFVESRLCGQLRALDLSGSGAGPAGLEALAASPQVSNLRSLRLHFADAQDRGAAALANSINLDHLELLSLPNNYITAAGAAALALSAELPNLRSLDLFANRVGQEGALALLNSQTRSALDELGLRFCDLDDAAAAAIANCPGLARFRALDLGHNRLTATGVVDLAASAHTKNLQHLSLVDNPLGDEGARALASSPHLAGLARLVIDHHNIGAVGKAALLARFGAAVQFGDVS